MKKYLLTALLLIACGEEKIDQHANFPRLLKAPQQILTKQYVDAEYKTIEKRLFTYDTHGRILSDRTFAVLDGQETLLNEKFFVWGEGNKLLWMQDGNTLKTFIYKTTLTTVPRIDTIRVEKKYGNELVFDHELKMDITNEGKLVGVYKYNNQRDIIGRTNVQLIEDEAKQIITEQERTGDGWRTVKTTTYTYNYGEPNHLHGLKSIDDGVFRTENFLNKNSELTGWETFKYLDGTLIPLQRAFIDETPDVGITRIEQLDTDKLIWNEKLLIETKYTSSGTSLYWEGPWSTESSADTIVSPEISKFYIVARCM